MRNCENLGWVHVARNTRIVFAFILVFDILTWGLHFPVLFYSFQQSRILFAGIWDSIEFCLPVVCASRNGWKEAKRCETRLGRWEDAEWWFWVFPVVLVCQRLKPHVLDVYDKTPFWSQQLLSFRVLHMWLHLYLKVWKKNFPLNQKSDHLEDLLAAHEHLSGIQTLLFSRHFFFFFFKPARVYLRTLCQVT